MHRSPLAPNTLRTKQMEGLRHPFATVLTVSLAAVRAGTGLPRHRPHSSTRGRRDPLAHAAERPPFEPPSRSRGGLRPRVSRCRTPPNPLPSLGFPRRLLSK